MMMEVLSEIISQCFHFPEQLREKARWWWRS